MVGNVSAMGNVPERNPFEWSANDHFVNMYNRIWRGDRRLEQMVQKNSVVQVIARKVGNTLRETYCLRSVLFSEQTVFHTDSLCPQVELLVTLQNRRNFSRFSRRRTDARGECKGQVARAGKKNIRVAIFVYFLQCLIRSWPPFTYSSRHQCSLNIEYVFIANFYFELTSHNWNS